MQQHHNVRGRRDHRHGHAQHDHRARRRRPVRAKVEADDQRDARRVHHRDAARDRAAPLQHHAPQRAQDHRQEKKHARHRRLLQAVLVALPRKRQERAHDQAQRDRREEDLRRRAPRRRHGDHRKVHEEHLRRVRELVPEQRGREVVVPRRVRREHAVAPARLARRVVHPHQARQQRAARKRHHAEHVVHHDRAAPRRQRQRQRRQRGRAVAVRERHRRLVHVPVHERHRRRPVELAEERVPEEDRVERDRQQADVQDHRLARDLALVHRLEARAAQAAARALVEDVREAAAEVRHLPAQAHQAQQQQHHGEVRAVELQLHPGGARILKALVRRTFYCVLAVYYKNLQKVHAKAFSQYEHHQYGHHSFQLSNPHLEVLSPVVNDVGIPTELHLEEFHLILHVI